MELFLQRREETAQQTFGTLAVDGRDFCLTLEDGVHAGPKIPGTTAIPAGRYRILLTHSRRFDRTLPQLCNVPGFFGIRIHAGNTTADTSGCILVGETRDANRLLQSKVALDPLIKAMEGAVYRNEDVWITLADPSEDLPRVA